MKQSIAPIALFAISIAMHAQEVILPVSKEKNQLVDLAQYAADDIVLSTVTTGIYQPFAAIKNRLQQGLPIDWRPSVLYRGGSSTLQGMMASTALQPPIKHIIEYLIPGDKTAYTQFAAAALAGGASALTAAPFELMMIQRQKNSASSQEIIKKIIMPQGIKTAWRGLPVTALREGGFSVGYLALTDIIASYLTNSDNPVVKSIVGGVPAGIIAALSTHPFDTIKTRMQTNLDQPKYKTASSTLITIVQKDGIKGLYAGVVPRMTACALLIPVMSYTANKLKSLHE